MNTPFETYKLILEHEYKDIHGKTIKLEDPIICAVTIDNTVPFRSPICFNEIIDRLYRSMNEFVAEKERERYKEKNK